ncbi:sphingomyelin phosphodiesterase [Alkalimarinus alittae]|uniref:Sphingomyelin phosphodiesterase n=1 Tax=Alkalimarinus alittae TaxID=2961619 RepID=A0ABY6N2S7_9ALTE|nr:sphingomyelin phosphodiesterase [Alkalimarinus alittae]UZE96391.1 sphingomyelin phosphodiesterase [Alkalimarinus alittae]
MLNRISIFILSMLIASISWAESYVYITNSTMETLSLDTVQTGYSNISEGNEWQQLAETVPPLATVKFLRYNRDKGIKWGKSYNFTTTVQGATSSVELTQRLVGTMTFSKMWLSAEDDPWYYDRDIHSIPMSFDGKESTLAFRSQPARASGDDIYYVINNDWKKETPEVASNNFKVLTYNTWALLPGIESKNTHARLDTIAEDIAQGYDAVVFQEVFDPALTAHFRKKISAEYPYLTRIPFKVGKLLTGGSFIASRHPIIEQDDQVYDACRAEGCLASKGMNYAKIDKGGKTYHLFGTHTHAYATADDISVRFDQLAQLKAFIDSKNIPANEPVLMGGDFNVDKVNFPQEHYDFLTLMDATEPMALGEYLHSYAGPVNVYATDKYVEYLDYVLYSNAHQAPVYSHNKLLVPRSIAPEHFTRWDLSDHFPVASEFVFPAE